MILVNGYLGQDVASFIQFKSEKTMDLFLTIETTIIH